MLDALYNLIITPLIYLIEIIFSLAFYMLKSAGPSIVVVSVVVNTLILPLYQTADRLQREERERQKAMSKWVDHIKKHFKGDEQYMMLSTYYRQQGYKPIYALRSSLSLLLQIPFFIAAYRYLSGVEILKGASFIGIQNLGAPDGLIQLGGMTLNLLPILMTLLNVVSGAVYTKGFSLKDKLQTYGLAVLFLFLLYDSPAGLVLYWTCNQIFSLVKNIINGVLSNRTNCDKPSHLAPTAFQESRESSIYTRLFIGSGLVLTALIGILIPSAYIGSSPTEFYSLSDYANPLHYVIATATIATGVFIIWLGVFFYLSTPRRRKVLALLLSAVAACSLVCYFFFGKNLGIITSSLIFETEPSYSPEEVNSNIAALLATIVIVILAWRFAPSILAPAMIITAVALIGAAYPNYSAISAANKEAQLLLAERNDESSQMSIDLFDDKGNVLPTIHLSRSGKNVVVLFLDRGISGYFPFMVNERPDIAEALEGFTYYPNTISYGARTVFGSPSIMGGYDYTVAAMNERDDTLLVDKHNEAAQLLPLLFSQKNYKVTLLSEAMVDYQLEAEDYSLFDDYENVTAYHAAQVYNKVAFPALDRVLEENFNRNLFFYGIFKCSPVALQPSVYHGGTYWTTMANHSINKEFLNYFSTLKILNDLTQIDDEYPGAYVHLHSLTTHTPDRMQLPEYEPSPYLRDYEEDMSRFTLADGSTVLMDNEVRLIHYHAFVATFIQLQNWFDYLKSEGIWDNTRIIIVSDHGYELGQFPNLIYDDSLDIEMVNPLFLVKDFSAKGPIVTDRQFMTTSDTAWLCLKDIVDNPVNPFTGNLINDEPKKEKQIVTTSVLWDVREFHRGTVFDTYDGHFYSVHDDIFNLDNWERLD